ncbi:alkaline phosphatase [Neolewinella xylanilytica]|uniref:Alkaline phosphatase n=1 Tax=Neolewinella xylanilytica TaxID=1514080 RepID=A0A2S6I826_9BACT|nr:alkaline phosphatase [Neolewinella xylanilytica]PPK87656.1 alkaline phosphatase [Neolewinella xylanilytica]
MSSRSRILLPLLTILLYGSLYSQQPAEEPLRVILLIGDGMGLAQISTAYYFGEAEPNFTRFDKIGLVKTNSISNKVTDSAAAATAIATGVRTYNRAISVSPDSVSVPSILERLRDEAGYRTGLVSLTSITHATPACFYAHVEDRDLHEEIAAQLVTADLDFFAGGGLDYFTKRADGRNLYAELAAQHYRLDSTDLSAPDPDRRNGYLLAPEALPSKVEGRGSFLPDATRMGLDYLTQTGEPFFLMVEGSYIDWAGHAENDTMLIEEMADFDATLGIVLDYVENNPNTLLLVTADHETGEASLGKKYQPHVVFGQRKEIPDEVAIRFHSNQHSAVHVPIFAKGPHEDLFLGIYQNNEIFTRLLAALDIE